MNLKPGVLRLSQWTKNFNPFMQHQTHAQIWIRLMDLPREYWRENTLREISGAIGFLSKCIFEDVLVEREGCLFNVELIYKRLLLFYSHSHIIGHNLSNCKWLHSSEEKEKIDIGKKPEQPVSKKKAVNSGRRRTMGATLEPHLQPP
jgi:hypothetical protein